MKNIYVLMSLMIALLFSNQAFAKQLNVVTTLPDFKSIAQYIGGDKIKADSLSNGYQDPHFVDPKPSYIIKLQKADLFIENGLELEMGWADQLVKSSRNASIFKGNEGYLFAGSGITVLEIPTGKVDRSMGDIHPSGNPHYTLDPLNGKIIARNIADKLSVLDPDNASYYSANLTKFNAEMDADVASWQAKLAPYKGTKIITYHNTWKYFADRFGFVVVDHVEPKAGVPPTADHLTKLIATIKREKIKLIIVDTYYDRSIPDRVAKETGAKVLELPTYVGAAPQAGSYFSLFDYDISQIINAFK
jgi:ABC-type Zn uptake system ZnuABC Zn-binding protein ZnuA